MCCWCCSPGHSLPVCVAGVVLLATVCVCCRYCSYCSPGHGLPVCVATLTWPRCVCVAGTVRTAHLATACLCVLPLSPDHGVCVLQVLFVLLTWPRPACVCCHSHLTTVCVCCRYCSYCSPGHGLPVCVAGVVPPTTLQPLSPGHGVCVLQVLFVLLTWPRPTCVCCRCCSSYYLTATLTWPRSVCVAGAVPAGPGGGVVPAGGAGLRLHPPGHGHSHGLPAAALQDPPAGPGADPARLGQGLPAGHVQRARLDRHCRHHGPHVRAGPKDQEYVSAAVSSSGGWVGGGGFQKYVFSCTS